MSSIIACVVVAADDCSVDLPDQKSYKVVIYNIHQL